MQKTTLYDNAENFAVNLSGAFAETTTVNSQQLKKSAKGLAQGYIAYHDNKNPYDLNTTKTSIIRKDTLRRQNLVSSALLNHAETLLQTYVTKYAMNKAGKDLCASLGDNWILYHSQLTGLQQPTTSAGSNMTISSLDRNEMVVYGAAQQQQNSGIRIKDVTAMIMHGITGMPVGMHRSSPPKKKKQKRRVSLLTTVAPQEIAPEALTLAFEPKTKQDVKKEKKLIWLRSMDYISEISSQTYMFSDAVIYKLAGIVMKKVMNELNVVNSGWMRNLSYLKDDYDDDYRRLIDDVNDIIKAHAKEAVEDYRAGRIRHLSHEELVAYANWKAEGNKTPNTSPVKLTYSSSSSSSKDY